MWGRRRGTLARCTPPPPAGTLWSLPLPSPPSTRPPSGCWRGSRCCSRSRSSHRQGDEFVARWGEVLKSPLSRVKSPLVRVNSPLGRVDSPLGRVKSPRPAIAGLLEALIQQREGGEALDRSTIVAGRRASVDIMYRKLLLISTCSSGGGT
eukprot:398241-Prorocentrum_minimum.AAC.1